MNSSIIQQPISEQYFLLDQQSNIKPPFSEFPYTITQLKQWSKVVKFLEHLSERKDDEQVYPI